MSHEMLNGPLIRYCRIATHGKRETGTTNLPMSHARVQFVTQPIRCVANQKRFFCCFVAVLRFCCEDSITNLFATTSSCRATPETVFCCESNQQTNSRQTMTVLRFCPSMPFVNSHLDTSHDFKIGYIYIRNRNALLQYQAAHTQTRPLCNRKTIGESDETMNRTTPKVNELFSTHERTNVVDV
jgi:hypothetical protein